jgi:TRAP transporter TAXI family solute receptor
MAVTVFEAYNGSRDFPKPLGALRIVAPLYPNRTHILVPDNSSVGSIGDLRGRRVSVGAPGSGTEQLARQVLAAHGITYADIDEQYLSFRESSDALRDGAIDAAILSVGFPASAVLEAVATAGARLLPIDSTHQRQLAERYPYYTPSVIPAGAYPGLDSAVPTVAVMNWIVATESLDGTVVTLLLDILRDEQERLVQVSRIAEQIDLSALRSAPIPLHPATAAWLEEQP